LQFRHKAHRAARIGPGQPAESQNRRLAQPIPAPTGTLPLAVYLFKRGSISLTASLTGFSLRSCGKLLARTIYFKINLLLSSLIKPV
jgi:hypothetical protein